MRTPLEVTEECTIAASTNVVWSVISSPAMHERLDPRCRLESTSGEAGQVSSEYLLTVRAGLFARFRLRYVIVDAEPSTRLVAEVSRGEKRAGEQRAELVPDGAGTLLRWTVVQWVSSPARRIAEATTRRQLTTWLEAVEREALAASAS